MPETTSQALSNAEWAKRNITLARGQIDSIRAKGRDGFEDAIAFAHAGMAQAHASLAIAEGQERVAEELEGVRRTLVAMHTGSPLDAVEASEEATLSPAIRRERAVNELLELTKIADNDLMRAELEDLASRFSLPPVRGARV